MQSTSTSATADNSTATSTPRRRGRPRVHATDSAKKAAYRQRKFERELAKLRRAAIRHLRKNPPPVVRDFLSEAKAAYVAGDHELALSLFELHESQQEMAEYDHEVTREELRAVKPAKHNRACRRDACLCGLSLSRGQFLTDAPKGRGKLVSGGYGHNKISAVSDAHESAMIDLEQFGGRGVDASGWSAARDIVTAGVARDPETDFTFMEKHFKDKSWLKCYVDGCRRLPWAVLEEDHDKPREQWRYACDLHKPVVG